MTTLREAAQQALEALEAFLSDELRPYEAAKTAAALRAVLAEDALQRLTDVQQEMESGCDRCRSPLWAGTKCDVCGRKT